MAEDTTAAETTAEEKTENTQTSSSVDLPAFYGVKAGMTRIFNEEGQHVPVTVIKLIPNVVSQIKTTEKDGYEAYQVAFGEKREKLVTKPVKGRLAKASIDKNLTQSAEVKVDGVSADALGKPLSYGLFDKDTYIDVNGVTKGKGFQGVMKRYGFRGGPAAHGSKFHRRTGSIGNRATPGKVWKQKRMPGHMGAKSQTIQNLKVVELNLEEGYMLLKGSIPGAKNSFVRISKAVKK